MKKTLLTLCFISSMGLVIPSISNADIVGSDHDFSGSTWSRGQICLPCHAPHNNANTTGEVLWNHEITAATFTVYSSPTMDANTGQPGGISKMCLSCHDGTVAIDAFGGANGSTNITGGAMLGTSLSNDHPISIQYNAGIFIADGGLANPNVALSGMTTSGTILADMLGNSWMLECSSCHDVHNEYNNPTLLNVNNAGSALCLTCHIK